MGVSVASARGCGYNNDNRNDKNNDVVEDNKDNKEDSAISYVACDGNTALLNVRNSVTGDIIV